jgi:hypothetical protein
MSKKVTFKHANSRHKIEMSSPSEKSQLHFSASDLKEIKKDYYHGPIDNYLNAYERALQTESRTFLAAADLSPHQKDQIRQAHANRIEELVAQQRQTIESEKHPMHLSGSHHDHPTVCVKNHFTREQCNKYQDLGKGGKRTRGKKRTREKKRTRKNVN